MRSCMQSRTQRSECQSGLWGGIDLVSASTGQIEKRYGLIYVDMNDKGEGTFERRRKDSFFWYKKCIESNGEDLD